MLQSHVCVLEGENMVGPACAFVPEGGKKVKFHIANSKSQHISTTNLDRSDWAARFNWID